MRKKSLAKVAMKVKISEVTVLDAIHHAKEDAEDEDIVKDFTAFLVAAKSFIRSYTGLTLEQLDDYEDVTIALFVLINDMHDNRAYIVREDKVNRTVQTILDMHSVNLI